MRLIDADAAVEQSRNDEYMWAYDLTDLEEFLTLVPTIDPESLRPKGRWKLMGEADYKCSVCGFRFTSGDPIEMFPYCRCGAKMEVE